MHGMKILHPPHWRKQVYHQDQFTGWTLTGVARSGSKQLPPRRITGLLRAPLLLWPPPATLTSRDTTAVCPYHAAHISAVQPGYIALWANHLKGWCIFWNWPLSGLQDVEVCAGLLQSVSRGAAECVQGYRVCAGCSFNILPCSSRLNQKIFY